MDESVKGSFREEKEMEIQSEIDQSIQDSVSEFISHPTNIGDQVVPKYLDVILSNIQ